MACVIAAPSSGSGKTLLSLVLTAWSRSRDLDIQLFKVGPDYLDPQQLSKVSRKPCRNLDLILSGKEWVKETFQHFGSAADLALVEGVMGLFDGVGSSDIGSTAELAKSLRLPVVLVVDAGGQAASLAALVKGFRDQDPEINLAGVVLNRISTERHKDLLEDVLATIGIKMLGWLPKSHQLNLPSKHLGLAPPNKLDEIDEKSKAWVSIAESNLDLERFKLLLKAPIKSQSSTSNLYHSFVTSPLKQYPIAVAEDKAFHFRYQDTKDSLEAFGMPVIPWSPIENEGIPKEAKGIIIPGGFPEEFAKELSQCSRSLEELRRCFGRLPIYAECGGMLLLGETLTDLNGERHEMAGLLPINSKKGNLKVGYRSIKGIKDSLVIRQGEQFVGHEFHRWDINLNSYKSRFNEQAKIDKFKVDLNSPWNIKGWGISQREEGWSNHIFHASWIHLHWASCTKLLKRWRNAVEDSTEKGQDFTY